MVQFLEGLAQNFLAQCLFVALWMLGPAMLEATKQSRISLASIASVTFYAVFGGSVALICILLFTQTHQQTKILKQFEQGSPIRPYFTQKRSDVQTLTDGIHTLSVYVQNNEIPAKNVVSQLVVLEKSLDPTIEPLHRKRLENANDVGPHGIYFQYWFMKIKPNTYPAFVMFQIRYTDALRDETYSQALFLRFLGVSHKGNYIQQLMHASSDEKARMERYMRERGIPML